MPRLRIGGISVTTPPRLRIGGIGAAGAVPTSGRLRIGGIGAAGTRAVLLAPFTDRTAEPLTPVTLTAALASGSDTPTSYTWRVKDGRPVSIVGTGASVVVTAPTCAPGSGTGPSAAYTVIAVTATKGSVVSPEVTCRIDSPPNQWWLPTSTGFVPTRAPQFA